MMMLVKICSGKNECARRTTSAWRSMETGFLQVYVLLQLLQRSITLFHNHMRRQYYYSIFFFLPATRLLNNWKPQKWTVISLIPLHFLESHAHAPGMLAFTDIGFLPFSIRQQSRFCSRDSSTRQETHKNGNSRVGKTRVIQGGGLFGTTHLTYRAKATPRTSVRHLHLHPKTNKIRTTDPTTRRPLTSIKSSCRTLRWCWNNSESTVRYVLRSATCDYVMNPKKVTLHRFPPARQPASRYRHRFVVRQQQHSANPNRGAFHVVYVYSNRQQMVAAWVQKQWASVRSPPSLGLGMLLLGEIELVYWKTAHNCFPCKSRFWYYEGWNVKNGLLNNIVFRMYQMAFPYLSGRRVFFLFLKVCIGIIICSFYPF